LPPAPFIEAGLREVELLVGVVRVRADRAEHVGKALGDGEDLAGR
jgi:hypothetical protein